MDTRIPISRPQIGRKEMVYVSNCLETGWVSSLGSYILDFEGRFSEFLGLRYSLSCSNGTAALHLALLGLGIEEGDEVITPSLTFVATVNAILYCRAKPIFVDIDPVTWCLDPGDVQKKLSPRTRAILPVHLYGNPAPMPYLQELAANHGVSLIEDCAEALGAEWDGQRVGSFGHLSTHSFYGNKIITCGEGGMVSTDSEEAYNRISMLRDHGMSKNKRYYHEMLAYNYRMTNLQAALGLAQLERIDSFIDQRTQIFDQYCHQLKELEEIQLPFSGDGSRKPVNWVFTTLVGERHRNELIAFLDRKGIGTRPTFLPCHRMPYVGAECTLPVTERVASAGVSLPTFVGLDTDQITFICNCIKDYFSQNR